MATVTATHKKMMRDAIAPLDTESARQTYRDGNFRRAEDCKDVNKRYRWDLFWAANTSYPEALAPILDANYKDTHIDTALRSIIPNVKAGENG